MSSQEGSRIPWPSPGLLDCCPGDVELNNVLLLSFSFMLVLTAFQTMGNMEQVVLNSVNVGNGYISLAIMYTVFAAANWIAPSIVSVLQEKWCMICGSVLYVFFIASFIFPNIWLLYIMSTVLGVGAAMIWTAQGSYLTLCSTPETISRNCGLFWTIVQCSMFLGNLFVYWQFEGKTVIDATTRNLVFAVLTGVAIAGVICLLFLKTPQMQFNLLSVGNDVGGESISNRGPFQAFKRSFAYSARKEMLLLFWTFLYTGIELCFFSGVYPSTIVFTNKLGPKAYQLVGLCGIFVGAGEVLGGITFGLLGSRTVKNGRELIVILGFIFHSLAFYLIFLNLPNASPMGHTDNISYISPPSGTISMFCAFLLGLGDSCFNTQILSILGSLFAEDSVAAFALYRFAQSGATAISFFYSSVVPLGIQLGILEFFCVIGTFTFCIVEWDDARKKRDVESEKLIPSQPDTEDRIGDPEIDFS